MNEVKKALTVGKLIEDLQACDQNSEICVVVHGIGITIPILGIMSVTADDRDLTILTVTRENVDTAMGYGYNPDNEH